MSAKEPEPRGEGPPVGTPTKEQILRIVNELSSDIDANRIRATELLSMAKKTRLADLVVGLMAILQNESNPAARHMAAVVLKGVLLGMRGESAGLFLLHQPVRAAMRNGVLRLLETERIASVRNGLTILAGHLGVALVTDGWWPELMPWIRKALGNKKVPEIRVSALQMLSEMANTVAHGMQADHAGIAAALRASMQDDAAPAMVRVAAVQCVAYILTEFERSASVADPFMPLGAGSLRVLQSLYQAHDHEACRKCLQALTDVATYQPGAFRAADKTMLTGMLQIAPVNTAPVQLRSAAIELVLAYAENASSAARRMPENAYARRTIPVLFGMLLEVGDDTAEAWLGRETSQESDPHAVCHVAEQAIGRLGSYLGAKRVLNTVLSMANVFSQTAERKKQWQFAHGAALALEACASFLPDDMPDEQYQNVAGMLVKLVEHPHPRVQQVAGEAFYHLVGQHPLTFAHAASAQISRAIGRLVASDHQRVQSQAFELLGEYAGHGVTQHVSSIAKPAARRAIELLGGTGGRTVREAALSCLSLIVDNCPEELSEEYARLMPIFIAIVENPERALAGRSRAAAAALQGADLRVARGHAIAAACGMIRSAARSGGPIGNRAIVSDGPRLVRLLLPVLRASVPPAVVRDAQEAASRIIAANTGASPQKGPRASTGPNTSDEFATAGLGGKPLGGDDPCRQDVAAGLQQLAGVLGPRFVPFLDDVMPLLLGMAHAGVDRKELSQEERLAQHEREFDPDYMADGYETYEGLHEEEAVAYRVKESSVDDKNVAVQVLHHFAEKFGPSTLLGKWAMPMAAVLLPIIATKETPYHHLRVLAAEAADSVLAAQVCSAAASLSGDALQLACRQSLLMALGPLLDVVSRNTKSESGLQLQYEAVRQIRGCLLAACEVRPHRVSCEGFLESTERGTVNGPQLPAGAGASAPASPGPGPASSPSGSASSSTASGPDAAALSEVLRGVPPWAMIPGRPVQGGQLLQDDTEGNLRWRRRYRPLLSEEHLERVLMVLMQVLRGSMQRVATTVAEVRSNASDFDEDEIEEVIAQVRELQSVQQEVCRAVGGVSLSHGAAALGPLRRTVFKAIEEHLAGAHSPPYNVFLAASMAEDVVAGCGPAVAPGLSKIMSIFGKGFSKGSIPALKRASVYALGSSCVYLGQRMGPHLKQVMGALHPLVQGALARDKALAEKRAPFPEPPAPSVGMPALEEQAFRPDPFDVQEQHLVLDNACSALGKVLHFTICGGGPRPLDAAVKVLGAEGGRSPAALARSFVQSLPLNYDQVECRSAVQLLAWRVELGCSLVLGKGGSMVPKLLGIFAYASHKATVRTAFVRAAVGRAVRTLRSKAPAGLIEEGLKPLPAKLKDALEAAVQYSQSPAACAGVPSGAPVSPAKGGAAIGGAAGSPVPPGSPW